MKNLPDQTTLNELLELAKDAFQSAKDMNNLAIKIEKKYQPSLDSLKDVIPSQKNH